MQSGYFFEQTNGVSLLERVYPLSCRIYPMNARRLTVLLVLGTLILFVASCVYTRLYSFKGQLNDFEENFEINDEGGLTLVFLNPVLESGDIVWLMKNGPSSKEELEEGELWTYVFEKQYLSSNDEGGSYDIPVSMVMKEEMLKEVTLPERFLKNLSVPLLKRMFSSMGDAEISKLRKSANSIFNGSNSEEIPKMQHIVDTLGKPYSVEESDETSKFTYLYYLKNGGPDSGSGAFEFKTEFIFRKDDESLQRAKGVIRGLSMSLDFSASGQ